MASFEWRPPEGPGALSGYLHLSDQAVVVEFEPAPAERPDLSAILATAMRDFNGIRKETDLSVKLAAATGLFRRLTGYDRVMVYRFDEDWHGEVVAEARRADLEPYLGLHYPASDIPAQARQVFLINPYRVILDVDGKPSALTPVLNPLSGEPLDLSRSLLRSVSPVHLEYLRNMGVGLQLYVASLTPHSVTAIQSVKTLCETWLAGHYELEVIDIYEQPCLAKGAQVFVAPTLVKTLPLPLRRLIGDMADPERVLAGLGLQPSGGAGPRS